LSRDLVVSGAARDRDAHPPEPYVKEHKQPESSISYKDKLSTLFRYKNPPRDFIAAALPRSIGFVRAGVAALFTPNPFRGYEAPSLFEGSRTPRTGVSAESFRLAPPLFATIRQEKWMGDSVCRVPQTQTNVSSGDRRIAKMIRCDPISFVLKPGKLAVGDSIELLASV
jgi:hypothetical protein